MNVFEALKDESLDIRVTCGHNRWLIWDADKGQWEVWVHEYRAKHSKCLYQSDSCDEAIKVLTN